MNNNIIFQESLRPQFQPIEDFFKIILFDKRILPVIIIGKSEPEMKLEGLYSVEELKCKLDSIIRLIRITLVTEKDFPKKFILETISQCLSEFQNILSNGIYLIFHPGYSIQEMPNMTMESITPDIDHWGMDICAEFCEVKYNSLKMLEDLLITPIKDKLITNLSVGDISLLFRLLKEEGLFKNEYNTELYRFIASSFSTKSSENLSEASIKNIFLSPDNTAIKNVDALLVNMRLQLKKIQ